MRVKIVSAVLQGYIYIASRKKELKKEKKRKLDSFGHHGLIKSQRD
jgi:hypothetical protein